MLVGGFSHREGGIAIVLLYKVECSYSGGV